MPPLVKKTDRMDISIMETEKRILIVQKWCYNWKTQPGISAWTTSQKRNFHDRVDKLIWSNWGGKHKIKVNGTSEFAKKYAKESFTVYFDIKWVLNQPHWNVNVTKIPSKGFVTSNVLWNSREINLDTEDTVFTYKGSYKNKKHYQYPVLHEFGHATGNTIKLPGMHGDEYKVSSAFFLDKTSIMNIGNELKKRHLDYIVQQLNTMIPNTRFYV